MDLSFIGHILQPFAKNDKKLFWHFFTLLKKETSFDYNLEAVQDIYKKLNRLVFRMYSAITCEKIFIKFAPLKKLKKGCKHYQLC